jgi:hypothetical protein
VCITASVAVHSNAAVIHAFSLFTLAVTHCSSTDVAALMHAYTAVTATATGMCTGQRA